MKFTPKNRNVLYYAERFKRNWRLKPSPRLGTISFRPQRGLATKGFK